MVRNFLNHYQSNLALSAVILYFFTFGLNSSIDYGLLILAISSAVLTLANNSSTEPYFINPSIGFFLLSILISNYFSENSQRSADLLLTLLPALLSYHLISHYFYQQQIERLLLAISIFSLLIAVYLLNIALFFNREIPAVWIEKSSLSYLKSPNSIIFIILLTPFVFHQLKNKYFFIKTVAMTGILLNLAISIIYQSRISLLVLLVIIVMSLYHKSLKKNFFILLGLSGIVILMDALTGYAFISKVWQHSWLSRLPLWLAAYDMFLDAPLFGHGGGSYLLLNPIFLKQQGEFALLNEDPRIAPWAHNLYLEVLAEQGIIGFIALLSLLVFYLRRGLKMLNKMPAIENLPLSPVLISMVGFCVAALFELSLWHQWVLLWLFMLLGLLDKLNQLKS